MKVVVIGNGIGGFSAASTIRQLSDQCELTIISREMIPLYSACALPKYISAKISRESTFIKTEKDYKQLKVNTVFGHEVKEINPISQKVIIDNGKTIPFNKLILATGSDAIVFGEPKKGVFRLKTLSDADQILKHRGKNVVVVGSGAIGIEVAIALYYRGYKVTIIETLESILPLGLDKKVADKVKEILNDKQIKVLNGERAIKVLGQDCVEGLATDRRELECDTVVWAIGMRPSVELAKQAGITVGEKGGIKINCYMETNVSGTYACGDCVESNDVLTGEPSLSLFWHNANSQGSVAAYNCMGITKRYQGSQNFLSVDVFGNHVVGFGYTELSLDRLRSMVLDNEFNDISIIESENKKKGSYFRLLVVGDRCMGGQFINILKDLGLLWSIMFRKRSIKELLKTFENEDLLGRRLWARRVSPFFEKNRIR